MSDVLEDQLLDESIPKIAFSTAVYAVLAAAVAMISNYHSDSAVIDQIKASDQWGYYQAKGIKAAMITNKIDILTSFGRAGAQEDLDKIAQYKKEQTEIAETAREKERMSELHTKRHTELARAESLLQIAIIVSAFSIIMRRRYYWNSSIPFAVLGVGMTIHGLFGSF